LAQIFDRGDKWELSIFPEITEAAEIIDEPEKGYSATLGYLPATDRHVVANVFYLKSMYSIEDVLAKIDALRNCERCDTLDKERLTLESINIPQQSTQVQTPASVLPQPIQHLPPVMAHSQIGVSPTYQQTVPAELPLSQRVGPDIKDMFASLVLDTYLTDAGKYFLGLMLNDDELSRSAYPESPEQIPRFMNEMVDFMSGKVDFMRTPEEAREFLSVAAIQQEAKGAPGKPGVRKRLPTAIDSIVIF